MPFIKGKVCSAEMYGKHPTIGYFHPIQTYYYGELLERVSIPTEKDHLIYWVDYEQLKGKIFVEMQNWALEQSIKQCIKQLPKTKGEENRG